eukprot:gene6367-12872_t
MFKSILQNNTSTICLRNIAPTRSLRYVPIRKMPVPNYEKRLDVAIIGSPNAGKSVLLNCLINEKLAATTRKRHTTRSQILGVFNHRNIQLAFYDTPGYVHSSEEMKGDVRLLREIATTTTSSADVVLIVVDASYTLNTRYKHTFAEMVRIAIDNAKDEIILVLNKVDLVVPKTKLLELTYDLVSLINGVKLGPDGAKDAALDTTTFMISAAQDDGVIDLKNYLLTISKFKPWLLSKKKGFTSLTKEQRIQEIILEMFLEHTHDEIPYIAEIKCKSVQDLNEKRIRIDVDITVDTPSQQRIIIGQQGRTLVKIRQTAAEVLEEIFNKQVILYLWIHVRKKDDE